MGNDIPGSCPVEAVRAILSLSDGELDYARGKLALDRIVAPSLDMGAAADELDRLASGAERLAGQDASLDARIAAVRRTIYDSGPWNRYRPFAYDHSDPEGTSVPNKLLHVYLERRLGNCVSMPILFLILADRLGLDVALAQAPLHVFLRHRLPGGHGVNLEATSGGHPARDEWYRQNFPMTDRALESGAYMRSLGRREGLALMAMTVLEYLLSENRFEEAIGVAQLIGDRNPRDVHALLAQGFAYGRLLQLEFEERYPGPHLVPEALRLRRLMLVERNNSLIAAAEALGWRPAK